MDAVIGQPAYPTQPSRSANSGLAEELLFVRQFAVKLKAGLSVEKCLAALSAETKNRTLRNACKEMHAQVAEGCPLTLAMREHPGVFDDCVVRLVEVGEQTGNLHAALPSVAQYLEHIGQLRRATHNAVAKPLEVLSMVFLALFIAVVILAFVAKEALPGANGAHPGAVSAADQLAIHVSGIVRMLWPLVGVVGGLYFLILRLAPNYPRSRAAIDWLTGKLPLVSGAFSSTARACLVRTVGILMSGGATLGEAMETAARTAGSPSARAAIALMIEKIEKGQPYVEALIEAGFMRRRDVNAMSSAERRGELDRFMLTIADGYERGASDEVRKLATVVQCAVVVVVALAIAFAALTLYVPVFILR